MKIRVLFMTVLVCFASSAISVEKEGDKNKEDKKQDEKKAAEAETEDTLTFPDGKMVEDTLVFEDYDSNKEKGENAAGTSNQRSREAGNSLGNTTDSRRNEALLVRGNFVQTKDKKEARPDPLKRPTKVEFKVYPNPSADGKICIQTNFGAPLEYKLMAPDGKILQSGTIKNDLHQLEDLPSGIYLLICTDGSSYKETEKIIVQ